MDNRQTILLDADKEELNGVVDSIIFASDNGKFAVFRLQPDGERAKLTVTINCEPPLVGQQVKLTGEWVKHPKYGIQFKALGIQLSSPTSIEGIERFLASGVIDGIGEVMAHRIVTKFGTDALDIIETSPARLLEVPGLGKKTLKKIVESYQEKAELKEVMLWLEEHGVSGTYAGKIYAKYSSFALDVLENHPYRMAQEVDGIGFITADAIAFANGFAKDSPERIEAGLEYTLMQLTLSGHCCVPDDYLISRAAKTLQVPIEAVGPALKNEIRKRRMDFEDTAKETLIYPHYLYQAETRTAEMLLKLKKKADKLFVDDPEELVDDWEADTGIKLAREQRKAVLGSLKHGVFVLTGGPGTGKTTVIRAMLDLLEMQGLEILLGAPTGRAAKRLGEAAGRKAQTVHRLLEAQGGYNDNGSMFAKDSDEQLDADVIILDEVSMMDIVLMQHFLEAVPTGCHVILVGDVDQLPAVGPGAVLKDILRSKVIPAVRLTEVFRQNEESLIVLNAHAINMGRIPISGEDFIFIESDDQAECANIIVQIVKEGFFGKEYSPRIDVQVLSPMHRQECGVENLNRLLQAELNPKSEDKPEFANSNHTFRLGDKVMQTKNNYTKQVFNGDIGFIIEVEPDHITVVYGDDQQVDYEKNELIELQLAYAMTVHKSQGSEYPVVVMPLVEGHYIMLQRNLLYTAVTRAKEVVVLVGSKAALNTAVTNDHTTKRYTLLAERLNKKLALK